MVYKKLIDLRKEDRKYFGGKAVNLGLMMQEGLPVPNGFAIHNEWTEKVSKNQYVLDDDDKTILKELFQQFEGKPFAVRSSGVMEDLSEHSFAGQYDTMLDIQSLDALYDGIVTCVQSSFNETATSYAKEKLSAETTAIGLILQEMIQGDVSGVMFTANPLSNNHEELVITAGLHYGFGIVDGTSAYDEYILNHKSGELISIKSNINKVELKKTLERSETLTNVHLQIMAKLATQISDYFKKPQDIEWVMQDNELYILQARDITTLYPIESEHLKKDKLHLYLCYNSVVQGMTAPYTPLGYEFCRCTFAGYTSIYYGGKKKILYPSWIPYINGRLHYDLTEVLGRRFIGKNILGSFDSKDTQCGNIIRDLYKIHRKTFLRQGGNFKLSIGIVKWGLSLNKYGKISKRDYNQGLTEAKAIGNDFVEDVRKRIEHVKSIGEKLKLIEDVNEQLLTISFQQVMFISYGLKAFDKWEKWFAKRYPDIDLSPLKLALPNNPTTEMGLELMALAMKKAGLEISMNDPEFLDFLKKYGHRSNSDTDLGAKRWSETPEILYNLLLHYMTDNHGKKAFEQNDTQKKEAEQLLDSLVEIVGRNHSTKKARKLRFDLENYRTLAGLRERPKFDMVKILAMFRAMLLEYADEHVKSGLLNEADDISYLFFKEILTLETMRPEEISMLIEERKQTFAKQLKETKIPRIILSNGETYYQSLSTSEFNNEKKLKGVPLSNGNIRGTVKIRSTPDINGLNQNDILVTHNTDPSWTPLFPAIGGLIMESGGPISHGAIVAREYGLPAVGGVPFATEILKEGEIVEINGRTGIINIIEKRQ